MNCPSCGKPIRGRALFCPSCGQKVSVTPTVRPSASVQASSHRLEQEQREGCARTITVLVLAGVALLMVIGLGAGAVHMGLRDRQEAVREAAWEHYERGGEHLAGEEYELAVAEFGLALQLDPSLEAAREALDVAQERLEGRPEPTSELQDEMSAAYLHEMAQAHERGDWPTVFATADRLIAVDPDYRRDEVDGMLFDALYQSGLQLVEQDRVTEALRMFDRALLLRPDDAAVTRARELATQYVTGLSYWERDWVLAIESLERVYALEPGYRDVQARLGEAHRRLGEQLADAQDWCGAEEQFTRALELASGGDLTLARERAAVQCAAHEARPTVEVTPGLVQAETPVPTGTYIGEIVRTEAIGSKKMFVRGHVLDAQGNGIGGVRVTIRAWDWSVTATSDGQGQFSFDGLANPVTYTVSLDDLPCVPLDVPGKWDTLTWIRFQPRDHQEQS